MRKLVIACAFLLVSCETPSKGDSPVSKDLHFTDSLDMGGSRQVYKVVDTAKHITCYIYSGYNKGGISCVKDDEVK